MGNRARNDGRTSHNAGLKVNQMHRTAQTLAAAVFPAVQFGYHFIQITAFSQVPTVGSVIRENQVFTFKRSAYADRDRLMAYVKMKGGFHPAFRVVRRNPLLGS